MNDNYNNDLPSLKEILKTNPTLFQEISDGIVDELLNPPTFDESKTWLITHAVNRSMDNLGYPMCYHPDRDTFFAEVTKRVEDRLSTVKH